MKKLIASLFVLFSLNSCYRYGYDIMYYTDFSKYLEDNFIITPTTDFAGKTYSVLGELSLKHSDGDSSDNFKTEQQIIDTLVFSAKQLGGNGIIGYKSNYISGDKYIAPYILYKGIVVLFDNMPKTKIDYISTIDNNKEINYKEYDYEKAISIVQEKNITLIGFTNKENLKVYFDPDINQYLLEKHFIEKYGSDTAKQLVQYDDYLRQNYLDNTK